MDRSGLPGFWAEWRGSQTLARMSVLYGYPLAGDIPPLEPGILGEAFFFEEWRNLTRTEKTALIRYTTALAPWFAEFIERAFTDFPDEFPPDALNSTFASEFAELEKGKPELLYNLITAISVKRPDKGLELLARFDDFEATPETADYKLEWLLDAVHNIICGGSTETAEAGRRAYRHLRGHLGFAILKLEHAQIVTGCALSLIARSDPSEMQHARNALADVMRIHRRYPTDDDIILDTAVAISNFINLLDLAHVSSATRWFRRFAKLATGRHDGDMAEAWVYAAYHLMLAWAQDDTEASNDVEASAAKTLHALILEFPDVGTYRRQIGDLFSGDLFGEAK